ncbi:PREDICTED: uncharacterized protein LOC108687321 [Atta colombica]|uniref:uncharacterized protein LOC108687321 n=1 Tax=Atta colombica TaxID=520822 RepID=UPI00084C777C|nr:PREDICTED: uncharacterized protein LOC108687321 [Atta colombica]
MLCAVCHHGRGQRFTFTFSLASLDFSSAVSLFFQCRATLISRNQVFIPPRLQPPPSPPPPLHSRRCHDQRISHDSTVTPRAKNSPRVPKIPTELTLSFEC